MGHFYKNGRESRFTNNDSIDELVERIVADKVAHGQLKDSELTFGELERCKASFKVTLKSMHHVRIEYPKAVE